MARRRKFVRKGIYAKRSGNKMGTRRTGGVVGRSRKYGAKPRRNKRR